MPDRSSASFHAARRPEAGVRAAAPRRRPDRLAVFVSLGALVLAFALAPSRAPSQPDATGSASEQSPLNLDYDDASPAAQARRIADSSASLSAVMLKMLAALAFVLGLIVLVAWLARRYLPAARRAEAGVDAIDIVSQRSLGPRRTLLIVRARGRCLLLGATPTAITRLADLDMPAGTEAEPDDNASFDAQMALLRDG